ncbi:symmetrical bis(5'-nucleosyl)-tetraphosphatase [Marinobacteraceae bacterium S3BR75-40.1]
MTDYAIGDIQGCYDRLLQVLDKIAFDPAKDCLWVAGDLINRGPDSLRTLRYIKGLGESARVVLGNHDLHLLAVALGGHSTRRKDTLDDILGAEDKADLVYWLRQQPLAHFDRERNLFMAHAGLPHIWTVTEALDHVRELHEVISGNLAPRFFDGMYGNRPEVWSSRLEGMDRWRVITNYFTRMRFIAEDGRLDMQTKEGADKAPDGFRPWFEWGRPDDVRVIFGHWAALNGQTSSDRYIGLDTGCVWGGQLTVMNLDSGERIHCEC